MPPFQTTSTRQNDIEFFAVAQVAPRPDNVEETANAGANLSTLNLLQPQISQVGRLAARVLNGEDVASAVRDEDCKVGKWMQAFGLLEIEKPGNIFELLTLLEHRIEAIIDVTPEDSPVTILAAFERRTGRADRSIFSGKSPSPLKALLGCLLEAVETIAARWNREGSIEKERSAELLSSDQQTLVVVGRDLLSKRVTAVPAERVFIDAKPATPSMETHQIGSNGLAAAASYEEAKLHAVLELVERDAVAIWWRNELRVPSAFGVGEDLEGVCGQVARWLRNRDRRLELLALPSDLDAKVVVAVSTDITGSRPVIGAAARFDLQEAADAAACELVQMEANLSYVAENVATHGRDILPERTRSIWTWHEMESIQSQPFLEPAGGGVGAGMKSEADLASLGTMLSSLQRAAVDVSVVELPSFLPSVFVVRAVSIALADLKNISARLVSVPPKLTAINNETYEPALNMNMAQVPL